MKLYLSTITFMLLTTMVMGQQFFTGQVYDIYTQKPISLATVKVDSNTVVLTDISGRFKIPCIANRVLEITHLSYETWSGKVDSCNGLFQIGLIPSVLNLNEVEVNAVISPDGTAMNQPQAIALLTRKELTRSSGLFLEETLNMESSIRMEKRTMSGGQRITIRGYGNGTNFNGMGYRAYLNGIPVTDASGTTILDDIDFSTLGKVEVIKGPASSLYGAGIAGVVNMYSRKPESQQTSISQEIIAGSYGLLRSNTRVETATDKSSIAINYGNQKYDSYRVHSASHKDYVALTGDFRPNEKQVVSTYFAYNNSYEQLAGQLDSTAFYNRENIAEQKYLDNDGHVAVKSFRSGISNTYKFSKSLSNMTSVFTSSRKLNQAYAVGYSDNLTTNVGGRTEFRLGFKLKKIQVNGVLGTELQRTSEILKTYGMKGGQYTKLKSDLDVVSIQTNVFTEWNVALSNRINVIAGASGNFLKYQIHDMQTLVSNPTHLDATGTKDFPSIITPHLALQYKVKENIMTYGSVSMGYAPPATSRVIIPFTGMTNEGLKPEYATQYEWGAKGNLFEQKLSWQVALFNMQVKDKITSKSVADHTGTVLYSYAVNAGNQDNKGVEMQLAYTVTPSSNPGLTIIRPFGSFTYNHCKYVDFKSNANDNASTIDYSGNYVIGVAPLMANLGVDLETKIGIYANATFQYVDAMNITYNNLHKAPAYHLLAAKVGFKKALGNHFKIDAFVGGNNLTQSLYYNMVFVNWERGLQPSIYSPGAYTATFYGGFNLKYTL